MCAARHLACPRRRAQVQLATSLIGGPYCCPGPQVQTAEEGSIKGDDTRCSLTSAASTPTPLTSTPSPTGAPSSSEPPGNRNARTTPAAPGGFGSGSFLLHPVAMWVLAGVSFLVMVYLWLTAGRPARRSVELADHARSTTGR